MVDFDDWDLVITHDAHTLNEVDKYLLNYFTPVIHIVFDKLWQEQPFVCKNLIRVLNFSETNKTFGLPDEIISNIKRPVFEAQSSGRRQGPVNDAFKNNAPLRAIHFLDGKSDVELTKTLIRYVNPVPFLNLTIISSSPATSVLETICNENISLNSSDGLTNDAISDFDLAITSGVHAIKALTLGVPTILFGPRGLGGLVNSKRIGDHVQWHFDGRVGGEIGELIPSSIFWAEINNLHANYSQIKSDTVEASSVLKRMLDPHRLLAQVEEEMQASLAMFKSVVSEEFYTLRPCHVKDVRVVPSTAQDVFILLNKMNKMVRALSGAESQFLRQCSGERAVHELLSDNETEADAQKGLLMELWQDKVLFFAKGI
jgi:hypothetical protein